MNKLSELLNNKKVLLIGPSANLLDDLKEIEHEEYDVVCRIDHHYKEVIDNYPTHIVYHNLISYGVDDHNWFIDNNVFLVLKLSLDFLPDEQRIQNTNAKKRAKFEKYNLYRKNNNFCTFGVGEWWDKVGLEKGRTVWNTGNLAIIDLLSYDITKLMAAGFDFYDTIYYHNSMPTKIAPKHKPKSQIPFMKKLYYDNNKFNACGKLKSILRDSL